MRSSLLSRGAAGPILRGNLLGQVLAPALLIVGGMDDPVIDLNRRAYEQLRSDKRLEIIDGATHLFEEPGTLEKVADAAAAWFNRHIVTGTEERPIVPQSQTHASTHGSPADIDKRSMIQSIIDDEREPWIIMKPSREDPTDPEELCIFENPAERTQVRVEIPLAWFRNHETTRIKRCIRQSLRQADGRG